MKKAKLLLAAVGVIAVASSALAAFAKIPHLFYKPDVFGNCTVSTLLTLTTAPQPNQQGVVTNLSTTRTEAPCTITVYTTN